MIRFDHVSKTYPGGTRAVDDFSLTIEQGSTTVFLGTSGCGKTTLMRMVNAMVTPTSGTVFVRDQDVTGADPVRLRRSIGYVLQEGGLFPHRSIADNIATVPRLEGVNKAESRERALELLTLVGLEREMADRYPSQLSGGQRQRVGVARALANRADILLMDEPFGALDPIVRADLQRELKEIRRALGTTILFVTHDVDEAFTLGDQVAVLSAGGRIEQVGTPTELLSFPASPFVAEFVGASRAARPVRVAGPGGLVLDEDGTPVGMLAVDGDEASAASGVSPTPRGSARLVTWLSSTWALIGQLTLAHLWIALPVIALSVAISVPVARWAAFSRRGGWVLSALSALYSVPSLPLLVVIPVIIGVALRSNANMIAVLTLYGVAVLVRQVAEGFRAIPGATLQAANACGYSLPRRFMEVELPLATPVIVAGTRVVATSTVSLVTVGAFIGVRSLGTLFTDGFQRGITVEVVAGLVATVLLALTIDALVQVSGWALTPWVRQERA